MDSVSYDFETVLCTSTLNTSSPVVRCSRDAIPPCFATPPVVVHLDFEHVVVRLVLKTLLLRLDFDNVTACHDFRNDLISKLGTKLFKRLDAGGRL